MAPTRKASFRMKIIKSYCAFIKGSFEHFSRSKIINLWHHWLHRQWSVSKGFFQRTQNVITEAAVLITSPHQAFLSIMRILPKLLNRCLDCNVIQYCWRSVSISSDCMDHLTGKFFAKTITARRSRKCSTMQSVSICFLSFFPYPECHWFPNLTFCLRWRWRESSFELAS